MGIDLYTLVAQIINLILLIWLLKKFLYQPILKMVDARQELILKSIKDAKDAEKEAQRQQDIYTQKVADFDKERFTLLKDVAEDAEKLRQNLLKEIQLAGQETKKNFQKEMLLQKQGFELSAQNIIVKNFKDFAGKAFKEMADEPLSRRIIEQFKKKISALSQKEKNQISQRINHEKKVRIQSDIKLTADDTQTLKAFFQKTFDTNEDVSFKFEQNPDLICGIEMQSGEDVISWNLANYLESFDINMDNEVNNLIQEE